MYEGKLVFSQLMDHPPQHTFRRLVERYGGDRSVRSLAARISSAAWHSRSWRE